MDNTKKRLNMMRGRKIKEIELYHNGIKIALVDGDIMTFYVSVSQNNNVSIGIEETRTW